MIASFFLLNHLPHTHCFMTLFQPDRLLILSTTLCQYIHPAYNSLGTSEMIKVRCCSNRHLKSCYQNLHRLLNVN